MKMSNDTKVTLGVLVVAVFAAVATYCVSLYVGAWDGLKYLTADMAPIAPIAIGVLLFALQFVHKAFAWIISGLSVVGIHMVWGWNLFWAICFVVPSVALVGLALAGGMGAAAWAMLARR